MKRVLQWVLWILFAPLGCASVRHIPATSTPAREARYYQTQDVASFAGGVACNLLSGLIVRDTTPLASVVRIGSCAVAGLARRQLDRGYRESFALVFTMGDVAAEFVRVVRRAIRGPR